MTLQQFCTEMFIAYNYQVNKWLIAACCIIWVVGISGNIVNLVVFRHKDMAHPINSIFWWLSISDLLELAIIALYQLYGTACNKPSIFVLGWRFENIYKAIIILTRMYLFQVIHTITVVLNIVLVFYQYTVVADPLKSKKSPLNDRSIKLAVICIYILSFILYLPFWYTHEIVKKEMLPGYPWTIQVTGGLNNLNDSVPGLIPGTNCLYKDPLVNIYVLVYGVVIRIGLLIILITLCTLLLLAMKNAYCNRQSLDTDPDRLSKARGNMNRMNVTIVTIITMFLMTEVPYALVSTLLLFLDRNSSACSKALQCSITPPLLLLNCCYNIFCYLIRIEQYRTTVKLLLRRGSVRSSVRLATELTQSTSI